MSARQHSELLDPPPPPADDYIAPAPRVSVQAFCASVADCAGSWIGATGADHRGFVLEEPNSGGVATVSDSLSLRFSVGLPANKELDERAYHSFVADRGGKTEWRMEHTATSQDFAG